MIKLARKAGLLKKKLNKGETMSVKKANNTTAKTATEEKVEKVFRDEATTQKPSFTNPLSIFSGVFSATGANDEALSVFFEGVKKYLETEKVLPNKAKVKSAGLPINAHMHEDLTHSHIVIATRLEGDKTVYIHSIALGVTGMPPLTADQLLTKLKNREPLILPGEVVCDELTINALTQLVSMKLDVNENDIVYTETLLIPDYADINDERLQEAATKISLNENISVLGSLTGSLPVLDVKTLSNAGKLEIDVSYTGNMPGKATTDAVGRPLIVQASLDLNAKPKDEFERGRVRAAETITSTKMYADYTVIEERLPNGMIERKTKANLITSAIGAAYPKLESFILGIVNMTVYSEPTRLLDFLLKVPRNFGILNLILEKDVDKDGNLIIEDTLSADARTAAEVISRYFDKHPIYAIEIGLGEAYTGVLEPFVALTTKYAREAATDINATIKDMTGFEIRETNILAAEPIYVPIGRYMDNKDKIWKDVREFDLVKILEVNDSDPVGLAYEWLKTYIPGAGQFERRMEVISQITNEVEFESRALRLIFNPEWLNEVVTAFDRAGYTPYANIGETTVGGGIDLNELTRIYGIGGATAGVGRSYSTGYSASYFAPADFYYRRRG